MVLKGSPANAIFSQGPQASKSEVFPTLECLPEIVRHAGGVLAEDGWVVVAQGTRDAAGQQGRQGVVHDAARQAQNLVGDGAALDEDATVSDCLDEARMLVEGEAVSNAAGSQEQGIKDVVVGGIAVSERLASMEEEGYLEALEDALLPEPKELRKQVGQWTARVFGTNKVVSGHQMRPGELGGNAVVHALDNGSRVEATE